MDGAPQLPEHGSTRSLQRHISNLEPACRWSIDMFQPCADDGKYIAECLAAGTASANNGGSFKEGKQEAALVLEGDTELNRRSKCL
jgi:hypothetical protein